MHEEGIRDPSFCFGEDNGVNRESTAEEKEKPYAYWIEDIFFDEQRKTAGQQYCERPLKVPKRSP